MAARFQVHGVALWQEDLNMVSLMMYPVDVRESTGLFTVIKIPMDNPFKDGSKNQGEEHTPDHDKKYRVNSVRQRAQ